MPKRGGARNDLFWLWTGETEYEGHLISADGVRLIARVRHADRWTPATGAPGMSVPLDVMERQRRLARRVGFGLSPAIHAGALLECRVVAIQPTRDPEFEVVLAGTFSRIADEDLEPLSRLSSNAALQYLQTQASRADARGRLRIG